MSVAINRPSETQTLHTVERLVNDALPPRWTFLSRRGAAKGDRRADALWSLEAPDGSIATFVVEAKRALYGSQLDQVLTRLTAFDGIPLVVTPYVSPSLRAALTERGVSYADTTGNLRLLAETPGLLVERTGATKDPWPSDETLRSLRGRGAGRAVRALVDFRAPYGLRELAERARVPLGSLSRVLDLLAREGLVTREQGGAVTSIDWEGAIRR